MIPVVYDFWYQYGDISSQDLMTVKEITEEAIYFQEKDFCDKPKMNQIIQASW